jgi:hypothetical protein
MHPNIVAVQERDPITPRFRHTPVSGGGDALIGFVPDATDRDVPTASMTGGKFHDSQPGLIRGTVVHYQNLHIRIRKAILLNDGP